MAMERVTSPTDPHRCKGATSNGQCQCVCAPGSPYCTIHGGATQVKQDKAIRVAQYYLTMYNASRSRELATPGSEAKALNGEVAILRMTLETLLNQCTSATDISIQSSKIADLVTKVERLVTQMHKLDIATGSVLDKATLALYADKVSAIIQARVQDPSILKAIVTDLSSLVLPDGTLALDREPTSTSGTRGPIPFLEDPDEDQE